MHIVINKDPVYIIEFDRVLALAYKWRRRFEYGLFEGGAEFIWRRRFEYGLFEGGAEFILENIQIAETCCMFMQKQVDMGDRLYWMIPLQWKGAERMHSADADVLENYRRHCLYSASLIVNWQDDYDWVTSHGFTKEANNLTLYFCKMNSHIIDFQKRIQGPVQEETRHV